MTIKFILSVMFALLSGGIFFSPVFAILVTKLASDNYAVAKDAANNISQTTIYKGEPAIFQPRGRIQNEKYKGRMVGAPISASGGCPYTEPPPLTAFVPGNGVTSFRSRTAKPDPIFWFYIPYPSDFDLPVKFELRDENGTIVSSPEEQLKKTGIVRVQLPKKLELDKNYYWSLKIICNQNRRDLDIYVDGFVTRVKATSSPIGKTPEQIASFYALNGLWHETLTTLIEDVCPQNPQIARSSITAILKSEFVGLERYAEHYATSLIGYCNPNS